MSDLTRTEIRNFIVENFLFGDDSRPLPDEMSLIDNDLVDSTGILELVGFLEEHFELKIADSDIVPANLDSIEKIVVFVRQKQAN
ncbi:MAG: acyl carrier protein [Rhizobium sp.]|nr:acyl carrier protein [Rhizobium sp.]